MNETKSPLYLAAFILLFGASYALASWQDPTQAPPNMDAIAEPLDVSVRTQTINNPGKTINGNLTIGGILTGNTTSSANVLVGARICLNGDCRSSWPSGGGAGGGYWATNTSNDIYNISPTRNVGIGTSTPNRQLHIVSSTGNNAEIDLSSSAVAGQTHWAMYYDRTSESLRFWKNGANRLTFNDTANSAYGVGGTLQFPFGTNLNDYWGMKSVVQNSATNSLCFFGWSQVGGNCKMQLYNDGALSISDNAVNPYAFGLKLYVDGKTYINGNLGVGTAYPGAVLHVASSDQSNVPRGDIIMSRYWNTNTNTRAGSIFHYYNSSIGVDQMVFGVAGGGGTYDAPNQYSQAKMVIGANGRVGIGTTAPGYTLDAVGQVNATGYCISGANCISAWPSGGSSQWSNVTNGINYTGGNVGIGVAAPNYKLDVGGDMQLTGTSKVYFGDNGTGEYIYSQRSGTYPLIIAAGFADRLAVVSGGNVGVNTISPTNLFTVNQATAITPSNSATYGLGLLNSGTTMLTLGADANYGYLQSWNGKPLQINNQGNNVGIGMAPSYKLDVSGSIRSSNEVIAGSDNGNAFRMINGNYGVFFRNDGANTWFLMTNSGDQYGSWNSLRPISFSNATGNVSIGNNALYVQHNANVGIGTTAPNNKLEVQNNVYNTYSIYAVNSATLGSAIGGNASYGSGVRGHSNTEYGVFGDTSANVSASAGVRGEASGASTYGVIGSNPSGYGVYCIGNTCGGTKVWTNTSDSRLKENVVTLTNALEKVEKLRGVNFNWKDKDGKKLGLQVGFIAQEVLPVLPEVVRKNADGYYAMDTASINALLVEAIKEQQKQIDELKVKIKK